MTCKNVAQYIVSVDPGQTTGWAVAEFLGSGRFGLIGTGEWTFAWDTAELALHTGVLRWFKELNDLAYPGVIVGSESGATVLWVIEDFILNPNVGGRGFSSARSGISPARVTSAFLAVLHSLCEPWVVRQQPIDISQFTGKVGNKRLHDRGLWIVGSEHKRDAVRHLLQFTRRNEFTLEPLLGV